MSTARVYVRNANLQREQGEVVDWRSLVLEKWWRGVGWWSLSMPLDHPRAPLFLKWGAGIIVSHHGKQFSGLRTLRRIELDDRGKLVLTVGGPDDSVWLARRRAEPCPAVWNPTETALSNGIAQSVAFPTAPQDVEKGLAETVAKHYVDAALANGAQQRRRVPHFRIASDGGRGRNVNVYSRFEMLLPLLEAIAIQGGDLGYGIEQVGQELVFDISLPTDRTKTMRFSVAAGTLRGLVAEDTDPEANDYLVAGQGEGTARTFISGQAPESIEEWGLIEGELMDRRDTDDTSELLSALDEELAKSKQRFSLTLTASETEARRFGRDWDLGTYGTVEIAGQRFAELVRGVKITWQAGQAASIEPTICTPNAPHPESLGIFEAQHSIAARTGRLERI